jgi:hypothetical protein
MLQNVCHTITMRKPITVGGPVYARRGDFLRIEPGQSRQKLGYYIVLLAYPWLTAYRG